VESSGPTGGGETIVPGEPVSPPAVKAPLVPATLRVEIVCGGGGVLPRPAALSNVNPAVAAPKLTPVTRALLPSKMLTWSPPD